MSGTTLADTSVAAIDILRTARRRNADAGVTGFLAKDGGTFVQLLEGPANAVEEVFRRIRRDMRHYGVDIRLDRRVEERSFPEWAMGYTSEPVDVAQPGEGIAARLSEIAGEPQPRRRVQMAEAMQRRGGEADQASRAGDGEAESSARVSGRASW